MNIKDVDEVGDGDFVIRKFENGFSDDRANLGEWQVCKLRFECRRVSGGDFDEETAVDFGKWRG